MLENLMGGRKETSCGTAGLRLSCLKSKSTKLSKGLLCFTTLTHQKMNQVSLPLMTFSFILTFESATKVQIARQSPRGKLSRWFASQRHVPGPSFANGCQNRFEPLCANAACARCVGFISSHFGREKSSALIFIPRLLLRGRVCVCVCLCLGAIWSGCIGCRGDYAQQPV